MPFKQFLPALPLLGASLASPHPRADPKIDWGTCNEAVVNTTLPADCANFTVPLDYTASGGGTIQLQLARIKAVVQPAKGTILLNFGGPGQESRGSLAAQAATLLALSGGEYNLAAFDPRGTGNTIPHDCFQTPQELEGFFQSQSWYDLNDTSLERMWERTTFDVEACYEDHKKIQPFLGTAFVARDLMSVVDALGEDGMLRYWGFSYGTTLGATVASMFPDRVDKFVIDGVQNPHEYYHALADFEEWSDSDRVFSEIFLSCARAGPLKCPMAAGNLTGEQMEATAWKIAGDLKTNPIRVDNETVYDYTIIRSLYALALYGPENWPVVATLLSYVATNQTSDPVFVKTSKALYNALIASAVTFAPLYGIHCSDRIPRLDTLDEFRPVQERLSSISKVMDGGSTALSMACAQWKTDAKERYLGDFQVKTKNPILIATNMYDGHTPIRSARNVSSSFEGSGMLVVNGFGHTTLAQPSTCNIRQTAAYWHNGTMPADDFVCEVDAEPYSNYTWADAIKAVYGDKLGNSGGNGSETQPPSPPPGTNGAVSGSSNGVMPMMLFASFLAVAVNVVGM